MAIPSVQVMHLFLVVYDRLAVATCGGPSSFFADINLPCQAAFLGKAGLQMKQIPLVPPVCHASAS